MNPDFQNCKLAICLPVSKQTPISFDFFLSFILMNKPYEYKLIIPRLEVEGSFESIASMRNDMVVQAIEDECSHLVMMDVDQTYPQNTLERLFSHRLPIVYAKVHRRYPPFDPILVRKDPQFNDDQKMLMVPEEEWKNNDILKVDSTGAGCFMAEIDIFYNLKFPWFRTIKENPRLGRKRMGEDMFFCLKRLGPAGYDVWVDTTLDIGHEAKVNVNEAFYNLVNLTKVKFNKIDNK